MKSNYISQSLKDTKKIAKKFASSLNGGEVILLLGDMGAGKTAFAREFIKSFGYKGVVASPTFTIMQQYVVKKFKIYHFDLYRIENVNEGYNFGIDEFLFNREINNIVLIEWPERIEKMLKGDFVVVSIKNKGAETREISFTRQKL